MVDKADTTGPAPAGADDHAGGTGPPEDVECLECCDSLQIVDGGFEFVHAEVIFKRDNKLYQGFCDHVLRCQPPESYDMLRDVSLIPQTIFPLYEPDLFGDIIPVPVASTCYVKRPSLISSNFHDDSVARLIRSEAALFQKLHEHPHPGIAEWLGCVVEENRFRGFVLRKYVETLRKRVEREAEIDSEQVMRAIEGAIDHLHSLGVAHNDVNPFNIMLDSDGLAILIDFDSTVPFGEKMDKPGTVGWNRGHQSLSDRLNDTNALKQLQEYLDSA